MSQTAAEAVTALPVSHSSEFLWGDTLHGGASWSLILKRGNALRIEDSEGGANVAALFFNFECPVERYNMPDTLKAQHTAHLTKNLVIYSDMGRVLGSIVEDTCGWHDPLCGHNSAAEVLKKYGPGTYQDCLNDWRRNPRDNFLQELAKYSLGLRDLGPCINFFSKVVVGNDGGMQFVPGNSKPGSCVEIRAEMNLLVVLDAGQHPLDPNPKYAPKSVRFSVWKSEPAGPNDPCRLSCPENERGFINTERYFL